MDFLKNEMTSFLSSVMVFCGRITRRDPDRPDEETGENVLEELCTRQIHSGAG